MPCVLTPTSSEYDFDSLIDGVRLLDMTAGTVLQPPNAYFVRHASKKFQADYNSTFQSDFERLAAVQNWTGKNFLKERALAGVAEFERHCGEHSKLAEWQRLCEDLGVGHFTSIKQCKAALRKVNVNIYAYLEFKRGKEQLHKFPTQQALLKNCKKRKRTFPLEAAKANTFLKVLLKDFGFRSHQ